MKTTVEKKNHNNIVMIIRRFVACQWASCFGVAINFPLICLFVQRLIELYSLEKIKILLKMQRFARSNDDE